MDLKKIFLCILLSTSFIVMPVEAKSSKEKVSTESYTITIPTGVTFDKDNKAKIEMTGKVEEHHQLNVEVSSENDFKLKQKNDTIAYTVMDGDEKVTKDTSWNFPDGKDYTEFEDENSIHKTLSLSTKGKEGAKGNYTDKLNFHFTDKTCYSLYIGTYLDDSELFAKDKRFSWDIKIGDNDVITTNHMDIYLPEGTTYEISNITTNDTNKYVYSGDQDVIKGQIEAKENVLEIHYTTKDKTVTLDANEGQFEDGSVSKTKTVEKGQVYGELPTPTRDGFHFEGWFTGQNDGTKVTEDSVLNGDSDVTLYAHWTALSYVLKNGNDFYNDLIRNYHLTSIRFDFMMSNQKNATEMDAAENEDGSIMAWIDDNELKVNIKGYSKNIIFNPDCSYMLNSNQDSSSVESIQFGDHIDTSQVVNMRGMFQNCSNLKTLDLSKLNTSNVVDMAHMFEGCSNLESLDLSSFDTSKVSDMTDMFKDCSKLTHVTLASQDEYARIKQMANPSETIHFYLKDGTQIN